jgi:multidrug efflux pump subunit AcrA (membrane-fusion protein)
MLTIYNKLEDVPEALREHYKLIEGRYVPEISDDHPVKANNAKLLTEKDAAEAKAANALTEVSATKAQLETARASSGLPRGHRAVPVADAELLEQIKAHGTGTEVTAKLAEHKTLKEESEGRKREDHLRKVAKILNYDNVEAFVLLSNLPDFEIKTKDGKETVVAKVKEGDTVTEKPQEFIESLPSIAPFIASLKTRSGVYAPEQWRDNAPPSTDIFANIRKSVQEVEKAALPPSAVEQRFGIQKTA